MKIILDMDPGVDDAVALILALNNPELEVLAVTTVAGNVSIEFTTTNALKIVERMKRADIPVHRGAAKPLLLTERDVITAAEIHGRDGLGNSGLELERMRENQVPAIEAMANLLNAHRDKEISVVATGPLTNIALLKLREPDAFARIRTISIMGGIYDNETKGNVTEFAEFNFYCDPDAASLALDTSGSQSPAIKTSGLEVTSNKDCAVDPELLSEICSAPAIASQLACAILRDPVRLQHSFNLHDVFAVFALLHPEEFEFRKCKAVAIDKSGRFKGRCTVSFGQGQIEATSGVNPERFVQNVLDGLKA